MFEYTNVEVDCVELSCLVGDVNAVDDATVGPGVVENEELPCTGGEGNDVDVVEGCSKVDDVVDDIGVVIYVELTSPVGGRDCVVVGVNDVTPVELSFFVVDGDVVDGVEDSVVVDAPYVELSSSSGVDGDVADAGVGIEVATCVELPCHGIDGDVVDVVKDSVVVDAKDDPFAGLSSSSGVDGDDPVDDPGDDMEVSTCVELPKADDAVDIVDVNSVELTSPVGRTDVVGVKECVVVGVNDVIPVELSFFVVDGDVDGPGDGPVVIAVELTCPVKDSVVVDVKDDPSVELYSSGVDGDVDDPGDGIEVATCVELPCHGIDGDVVDVVDVVKNSVVDVKGDPCDGLSSSSGVDGDDDDPEDDMEVATCVELPCHGIDGDVVDVVDVVKDTVVVDAKDAPCVEFSFSGVDGDVDDPGDGIEVVTYVELPTVDDAVDIIDVVISVELTSPVGRTDAVGVKDCLVVGVNDVTSVELSFFVVDDADDSVVDVKDDPSVELSSSGVDGDVDDSEDDMEVATCVELSCHGIDGDVVDVVDVVKDSVVDVKDDPCVGLSSSSGVDGDDPVDDPGDDMEVSTCVELPTVDDAVDIIDVVISVELTSLVGRTDAVGGKDCVVVGGNDVTPVKLSFFVVDGDVDDPVVIAVDVTCPVKDSVVADVKDAPCVEFSSSGVDGDVNSDDDPEEDMEVSTCVELPTVDDGVDIIDVVVAVELTFPVKVSVVADVKDDPCAALSSSSGVDGDVDDPGDGIEVATVTVEDAVDIIDVVISVEVTCPVKDSVVVDMNDDPCVELPLSGEDGDVDSAVDGTFVATDVKLSCPDDEGNVVDDVRDCPGDDMCDVEFVV
ncbi:hypothetical protein C0Q70_21752 [Pomacea canaliculata]|uniref:Uncharacterized protein n=1 Tax=Pomacea canaliculata TaxID=400727 RepID=A0A2T7NDE1_POMCA|nr:hypothetical protein C0Q70_21752 [Pomacea canaliculata]